MDFWSVLYTVVLYSALTLVGVLVFYAINRVAQATLATDLYPMGDNYSLISLIGVAQCRALLSVACWRLYRGVVSIPLWGVAKSNYS